MVHHLDLTDSALAAKSLLGWKILHKDKHGETGGYIVETESYAMDDPASHAYGGEKVRNSSMYKPAGTIYVYFTYGMHFCMNIVTGPKGHGQGVLIRAIQPTDGLEIMARRRNKRQDDINLTNGPAKLAQALGINKSDDGKDIYSGEFMIQPGFNPEHITTTTRVGISKSKDHPLRFYITNNPYVSKL